jgi:hypothetical protein
MNKAEMSEILRTGPCKVTFEKADNSLREMVCTLKDEYITVESAGSAKPNPATMVVWDIEKEAWRSFRLDRLISGPEPIV